MAASSKIQFLILYGSLFYCDLTFAIDYVISQSDNMLDGGIVIGPASPLVLQAGDTLTLKNGKNINFDPNAGTNMIISYGNNTINIETGSSIKSTRVVTSPANTNVIKFNGSGSSTININSGATLQSSDPSSAALFNANIFSGGNENLTIINSGNIIGPGYFNNLTNGNSSLILLGTGLSVQNSLNSLSLSPNGSTSTMWVGGQINSEGKTTLTQTTYTTTSDYYPFNNIRVFATSSMTMATQTLSGPAITNSLQIDATASFTLTGAPSGAAGLIFAVSNLQNDGSLTVANTFTNGNFRTLQIGNLTNNSSINVTNGSALTGIDQTTSNANNNKAGSINIVSGKLSNFNNFQNAGSITVSDTLSNINTFNNTAAGLVSLMAGATVANLGVLNNGNGTSFQVNGATFNDVAGLPNYQNLTVNNDGSFIVSNGTFKVLEFTNNQLFTLSGGTISGYALNPASFINKPGATFAATGGALTNIASFNNYGTMNLAGMTTDSTVVNLYNYGVINNPSGTLQVSNLYNKEQGTYNLTGSASIIPPVNPLGNLITTYGTMLVDTTGTINSAIQNGPAVTAVASNAKLTINKVAAMYSIINNASMSINGVISITPTPAINFSASIENNSYIALNDANITVTTAINPIFNGANSVIDITGPLTLNFSAGGADITTGPNIYANFTNQGYVNCKAQNGTITYANAGTNVFYVSSIGTLSVYSNTTLVNANYSNYGVHYAYINSAQDPSTFTVQGTVDLANCLFQFDVNPALSGKYTFKILDSTGIINPPSNSTAVNTFLLKKSVVWNESMILVDYERTNLTSFKLSKNAMQLATAIEILLGQKGLNNSDLNKIYQGICNNVNSEAELEEYLNSKLPIASVPVQNAAVQHVVANQIDTRMQATRVAYNSADYSSGFSPWFKYFVTKNHQKPVTNNLGYKFGSHGLVFGMDNYDGVGTQYGLSLTFASSLLEQQNNIPSKSKTHVYQANIYSQNIRANNYYTDWIVGLTHSTTVQNRLDTSNNNKLAYSKYSWQQYTGKYEFGYIYDIRKEYYVVPYVSAHYTFLKNYQYQEYNDSPNNLFIISPAKHIFEVGAGVRADMHLLLYNRDLIPRLTMGFKYCLSSPIYNIDASIIDQNIVFQTFTAVPRLKYYSGLGATFEVVDNLIISANIEAEVYKKYLGLSYNFMLRYVF